MKATAVILVICWLLVNTVRAQTYAQRDAELCMEGTGIDLLDIEICGRAIRATAELSKASRATLHSARGRAHAARGAYDLAVADLDIALRLNPASASAYNFRGLARRGQGLLELAVEDFGRAIALFPRYAEAFRNRGASYYFLGDTTRAIADCTTAIALNAADPEPFARRGVARYQRGQFVQAAEDFTHLESMQYPYKYLALWKYLARARAQLDARDDLATAAAQLHTGEWPLPLMAAYLETVTPQAALEAARAAPTSLRASRLSETQFYLGELAALRGDTRRAAALFRGTVAAGFTQSIEGVHPVRRAWRILRHGLSRRRGQR